MHLTRRAWLAMLGAASTLRGAARLARYPYVANVRRDRATITWTTLDPGAGSVEFAPDDSFSFRSAAGVEEFSSARTGLGYAYHQFRADLNGLRPDTEYRYRVAVDGAVLDGGPLLRFRTPGSGPLKFVAVGDTGQNTAVQNEIALLMAEENPALIVHTGDVVYPVGGWTEYQDFYFTPYEDLARRAPFYLSLGNHDVMTSSGDPYLSLHAHPSDGVPAADRGRYYSFDWGNVHFLSLDSNAPVIPGEAAMARMLQWLDNDLAASRQFWRIAYFHHPPYA
ncbi:MAG: metallophosphoesterase, partial [Bryobacteraceae bacterium]